MQLYDLNKKGTIIVGQMRSGTQHLLSSINIELEKNNIQTNNNGEYFKDTFNKDIQLGPKKYSFFNIIDKIKEQDKGTAYSVGTIVYPTTFDMISQYNENYKYFSENYHLIKLIRKDMMAHFMSYMVFKASFAKHSGILSLDEIKINIPYKPLVTELVPFMNARLEIERFKADTTVYYEDLSNYQSALLKNNYGISPKDFFANYDEIFNYFKQLNITHYER
jgi:hypothetical protein